MHDKQTVVDLRDLFRRLGDFHESVVAEWLAEYYEYCHAIPCRGVLRRSYPCATELAYMRSVSGVVLDDYLPSPRELGMDGQLMFQIKRRFLIITEDEHGTPAGRRDMCP